MLIDDAARQIHPGAQLPQLAAYGRGQPRFLAKLAPSRVEVGFAMLERTARRRPIGSRPVRMNVVVADQQQRAGSIEDDEPSDVTLTHSWGVPSPGTRAARRWGGTSRAAARGPSANRNPDCSPRGLARRRA